jgi:hypothetical protein
MKRILLFCFIASCVSFSQDKGETALTGNLKADIKISLEQSNYQKINIAPAAQRKKSVFLGGLFSLILPGAGQFYAEDYIKTGIFLAVEAAAIVVGLTYDKKGDDKTAEFEGFADDNWDVSKYARWMNRHLGTNISVDSLTPGLKPWERVNFAELNAAERTISHFSHTLPQKGDQQYYEMIGKYHQFSSGWVDYDFNNPNNSQISQNYNFYSGMRGDANSFYNTAAKAVIVIYVNHFLSALEAVWSISRYNKDIAMNVRLDQVSTGWGSEIIPKVNFRWGF